MKIRVFHNLSRDASFGLNTVFEPYPPEAGEHGAVKRQAATAGERHPLAWVFEHEVPFAQQDDYGLLEELWRVFNIGNPLADSTAGAYRARRLRSLSVGDVVMLGERYFSAEPVGFRERERDELRILPAAEADAIIREQYQFLAGEELAISVPLPD